MTPFHALLVPPGASTPIPAPSAAPPSTAQRCLFLVGMPRTLLRSGSRSAAKPCTINMDTHKKTASVRRIIFLFSSLVGFLRGRSELSSRPRFVAFVLRQQVGQVTDWEVRFPRYSFCSDRWTTGSPEFVWCK